MDPIVALRRIAYLHERRGAPLYRSRAFRRAAEAVAALSPEEVRSRVVAGSLRDLRGIGEITGQVVEEALRGGVPAYLAKLESDPAPEPASPASAPPSASSPLPRW